MLLTVFMYLRNNNNNQFSPNRSQNNTSSLNPYLTFMQSVQRLQRNIANRAKLRTVVLKQSCFNTENDLMEALLTTNAVSLL